MTQPATGKTLTVSRSSYCTSLRGYIQKQGKHPIHMFSYFTGLAPGFITSAADRITYKSSLWRKCIAVLIKNGV